RVRDVRERVVTGRSGARRALHVLAVRVTSRLLLRQRVGAGPEVRKGIRAVDASRPRHGHGRAEIVGASQADGRTGNAGFGWLLRAVVIRVQVDKPAQRRRQQLAEVVVRAVDARIQTNIGERVVPGRAGSWSSLRVLAIEVRE